MSSYNVSRRPNQVYATIYRSYIYPCTIIRARYGGVYEGGAWIAFPLHPEEVPANATGGDVECAMWFSDPTVVTGRGETPDEALATLIGAVRECEPWDFDTIMTKMTQEAQDAGQYE